MGFCDDSLKKLVYICLQITNFTSQERERTMAMNAHYHKMKESEEIKNAIRDRDTQVSKYQRKIHGNESNELEKLRVSSIRAQAVLSSYNRKPKYSNGLNESWELPHSSPSYLSPSSHIGNSFIPNHKSFTPFSSLSTFKTGLSETSYSGNHGYNDPGADSLWRDPANFRSYKRS